MARDISVGIDIGTHQVKVVAASENPSSSLPQVQGTGFAQSEGMRHGYAIDVEAVADSVRSAVQQASQSANRRLERAHLSIGGASLRGQHTSGSISWHDQNHEITPDDIEAAIDNSEHALGERHHKNRTVLHRFPLAYRVDGRTTLGRPVGIHGSQLDVRTLFITSLSQHLYDLVEAVERADIEVDEIVAAPLAASEIALTDAQKIAGCVLANIGSETVSIIVFDDNQPISLAVFPIGSTDITNDIALGLKVSLEKAEQIKLGGIAGSDVSEKKLEEIMAARLDDIFELIQDHLEKINKKGLLPAGIIMTGGGSGLSMVEDVAKANLELPSKVAHIKLPKTKVIRELENSSWAVSYGTAARGLRNQPDDLLSQVRSSRRTVLSWLKQFLP